MVQILARKYLWRRGEAFYFRWTVPGDLRHIVGMREIRRSLATGDQRQAVARAMRYFSPVLEILRLRQDLRAGAISIGEYDEQMKDQCESLRDMAKKKKKTTNRVGWIGIGDIAIDFPGDPDREMAAAKELMAHQAELDITKARELSGQGIPAASDAFLHGSPAPSGTQFSRGSQLPLMCFSELFDKFMRHKTDESDKPLRSKYRKDIERTYQNILAIMGDPPIAQLDRKVLTDAIRAHGALPKQHLKEYKSKTVLELLEMEVPDEHRKAAKTGMGEAKKLLQGVFAYAESLDSTYASPARNLRLKIPPSVSFARFTDVDARMILNHTAGLDDWKRWIPALAFYTGARRGELVKLRKQDIKTDADSSRHYLLISEEAGGTKSDSAHRQVPLHAWLVKQGFLDFVEGQADGPLFGDLDPQAVTKWFMPMLAELGIERFDDFGGRKVLHSTRHTVITKAREAGNPQDHVQQVVGHEKVSAGITDRYTHRYAIKAVANVIDCLDYGVK